MHTITMAALEYEYEQQINEEETVSLLGTTGELGQGFYAAVATRTTRALVVLVAFATAAFLYLRVQELCRF
jgi:hypothetical protein